MSEDIFSQLTVQLIIISYFFLITSVVFGGQELIFAMTFHFLLYYGYTLRAESLSIFLDKSGRRKKTLPAGSRFRVEHALKIQTYLGVGHAWLVTAKPQNQNKH